MVAKVLALICLLTLPGCANYISPSDDQPGSMPDAKSARALLSLHNEARINGAKCGSNTRSLAWNTKLARAAKQHSTDMANGGFLAHKGSDGSSAQDRLDQVGYNWIAYGENISHGQESAEIAVREWLESKGHCKNIMNADFKEMGAAKVGEFWTVILGSRP